MDSLTEIKTILALLLETEVKSKADLKDWYELAQSVEQLASASSIELPHLVWHYLSDADIRLKEPDYGKDQIEEVQSFIDS
ncbi:hypothetical protein ACFSJ3_05700 [Corallincola platygyrae]|uniref:Uncharacterized protein n=1 Tax=Corallincola platygyrae TaxID=1193278 RepID=A0ABW4XMD6_9GAMM